MTDLPHGARTKTPKGQPIVLAEGGPVPPFEPRVVAGPAPGGDDAPDQMIVTGPDPDMVLFQGDCVSTTFEPMLKVGSQYDVRAAQVGPHLRYDVRAHVESRNPS